MKIKFNEENFCKLFFFLFGFDCSGQKQITLLQEHQFFFCVKTPMEIPDWNTLSLSSGLLTFLFQWESWQISSLKDVLLGKVVNPGPNYQFSIVNPQKFPIKLSDRNSFPYFELRFQWGIMNLHFFEKKTNKKRKF